MLGKSRKLIYLFPFIVYMSIFFLYGIYYGVMNSFGFNRIIGESGFTLEYYSRVFEDESFVRALLFTTKISVVSASISLILSVGLLFLIYINMKNKYFNFKLFQKIVESPLLIPYIIAAYAILIFFMQSGILSKFLINLGVIESYKEFPILTNDKTGIGIIFTYVWKTIPFIVMMTTPIIVKIKNRWEPLARVYNLRDIDFFIRIILPLIFPTLLVSFFIILAYFFTAFETPYILGVTYPKSIAVYVFELYSTGKLEDRGIIMCINICITVISLSVGGVVYYLTKLFTKVDERG